jgi:hypothetical protein
VLAVPGVVEAQETVQLRLVNHLASLTIQRHQPAVVAEDHTRAQGGDLAARESRCAALTGSSGSLTLVPEEPPAVPDGGASPPPDPAPGAQADSSRAVAEKEAMEPSRRVVRVAAGAESIMAGAG